MRRLKLSPVQGELILILDELGEDDAESIRATLKPVDDATFARALDGLRRLGLVADSEEAMILRIREALVREPHFLRLTFNDGTSKQVDVRPLLVGPIFDLLRDPSYFARATLDPICGTVVWPNGADFAPEALHELKAEAAPESAARPPDHGGVC